jgi:hypothetical protein
VKKQTTEQTPEAPCEHEVASTYQHRVKNGCENVLLLANPRNECLPKTQVNRQETLGDAVACNRAR